MFTHLIVFLTVSAATTLTSKDILLRLLSVFLLITINAFFVAAEFSIVSVRRSRINQLVAAGDIQAKTVQSLQQSIDRLLSTTQLGITLSSLALGWIGENTMAVLVAEMFKKLPVPPEQGQAISHAIAIPVAFFLIAYLQIVLGELCPKSVALLYSEQLARFLGPPSIAIARFFNPFIWILNQSTRCLLRMVGIQYTGQSWHNQVTPEELQLIITTERESSGLEAEERELLNNVFEFGEVLASEVMVRRTSIHSIPSTATLQTILTEIAQTQHSHYPVIGESIDDIRGIIDFKELAKPLSEGNLSLETNIDLWIHPAQFVPEVMPLSELLPLMQRSHLAMVIVVDEFGGTAGLVTLKDLVAEIIGDNPKSESTDDSPIKVIDERTFIVQAQMNLEEVNEILELNLPMTDEYQTLGGFVLYKFQKIPLAGESLQYENLQLTVISAAGPRLDQISLQIQEVTRSQEGYMDRGIIEMTATIDETVTRSDLRKSSANDLSSNHYSS